MPDVQIKVDDTGIQALFKSLEGVSDDPVFRQNIVDSAFILELECKKELTRLVYRSPETWYKRKHGSGLFGATKASGEVDKIRKGVIRTSVISNKKYAVYVHFGTGKYAQDGDGRKTPWLYEDVQGFWHWTEGVRPKPYMTLGAQKALPKIVKLMSKIK